MIDFTCPQCLSAFSVPDNLGGRRARCKKCGTPLSVPSSATEEILIEPQQRGPNLPPRTRRLKADADQMKQAFEKFPLIKIRSANGDPPDSYLIEYFVKGL